MNGRGRVAEFLDYGGSELFSQLMSGCEDRDEGVGRLIKLLEEYSDVCLLIKGRSAAYRFMIRSACRRGWLRKGCGDTKGYRLTQNEREGISGVLEAYISSGGIWAAALKKLAKAVLAAAALVLLIYLLVSYFNSDSFKSMTWGVQNIG